MLTTFGVGLLLVLLRRRGQGPRSLSSLPGAPVGGACLTLRLCAQLVRGCGLFGKWGVDDDSLGQCPRCGGVAFGGVGLAREPGGLLPPVACLRGELLAVGSAGSGGLVLGLSVRAQLRELGGQAL